MSRTRVGVFTGMPMSVLRVVREITTALRAPIRLTFAVAVAARVFPKSQRSWEAVTVAVVESDVADVVTLRVNDSGANWPDGLGPDDTVFCSNPFHWPLS